jgi:dipeptidyl aminopeptidase/acylaminoacyl peptidase
MFRRFTTMRIITVQIIVGLLLVACGQSQERPQAVPTRIDLEAKATLEARIAQATLMAGTLQPTREAGEAVPDSSLPAVTLGPPTETPVGPTLPPTYTPTISPTFTPSKTPVLPTDLPTGYNPAGTLYYIFKDDSIAALAGDGANEELIALGGPYSDLIASADGKLLAYVAPGSGSAREVYITLRDNPTYIQPISCLGMAHIEQLAWHPNGETIAFVAAPAENAAKDIYITGIFGANTCPAGNNQRVFVPLVSEFAGDPLWSPDGTKFFFTSNAIFGRDTTVDAPPVPLSIPSGFGPDYALAHSPVDTTLAYLRLTRDFESGIYGSKLFYIDTKTISETPLEQGGAEFGARQLRWNMAGTELLISGEDSFYLFNMVFATSTRLISGTTFPPQAVFSPDGKTIAYINGSEENSTVPQIFLIDRLGGTPTQLTNHPDGTISDLLWLEG